MSRLEKSVPKTAEKAESDLPASIKDLKIDNAPLPLRQVLAAKTATEKGTTNEGKQLSRNASMHMGGYEGQRQTTLLPGSPPTGPTTLGTLPSFSENCDSPVRNGVDKCEGEEDADADASSPVEGDEGKCAEEVLADVQASEEIFGKAFRGGPKAAAGLAARLQREVS